MKDRLDRAAYTLPPALDAALAPLWSDGHFAVDGSDLAFLNMCMAAARPDLILEIGTATGLSTAALAVLQARMTSRQPRLLCRPISAAPPQSDAQLPHM